MTVSGESKAVTPEMVAGWNETILPSLLSDYGIENVYNVDKFVLFNQCLPDKSYQLTIDCLCLLLVKPKIQVILKIFSLLFSYFKNFFSI